MRAHNVASSSIMSMMKHERVHTHVRIDDGEKKERERAFVFVSFFFFSNKCGQRSARSIVSWLCVIIFT